MNKHILAMQAGAAALLLSGAALADGMPTKRYDAPQPCCDANWNGFTVGVGVGVTTFVTRQTDVVTQPPPPAAPPPPPTHDPYDGLGGHGLLGTVMIGYDRMLSPGVVVGVFADYDFSDAEFTRTNNIVETIEMSDAWSLGARIGLVRNCCTLWYVNAGYTNAHFKYTFSDGIATFGHKERVDGWFAGLGVEQQIGRNLGLKLEYRYSHLDDSGLSFHDSAGARHDMTFEPETHSVRLGVTYRFSRDRDHVPLK